MAEVLASAAAEDHATPPVAPVQPARPRENFAERRLSGMAEAARMTKKPTIRIKPDECSIWPGNARDYDKLTEEGVRPLIDSILASAGNNVPGLVRRTPGADRPYELIFGTRRHFATAWLNANSHPEIELTVIVDDVDDETAFRLADVENREREDVSDLERARSYKDAIARYYGGQQKSMAERLAISPSRLNELLLLAHLPEEVIGAYSEIGDIKVHHAVRLTPLLRSSETRPKVLQIATQIRSENDQRRASGQPPIDAPSILKRLTNFAAPAPGKIRAVVATASGARIGNIASDRKSGIALELRPPADMSVDDILAALRPILENAKFRSGK